MPPELAMNRWTDLLEQPTAIAASTNLSPAETLR
jgi:hypothetical protein